MSIPYKPRKYMETAIQFLVEHTHAGLFLKPGLGKTGIVLAAFKILKKVGFVKTMLVIAPLRPCYSVWPAEIEKWSDFNRFSIGILHGSKKERVLNEKHDIYVINPEGTRWLFNTLRRNMPFDMLVVDESSRYKHINTDRFKVIKPFLHRFKRRVILTGSPAANNLLDLFGQMFVLDLGKALSPYITYFRNKFFVKRTFEVRHPNPDKAALGLMLKINAWDTTPEKKALLFEYIAPSVLHISELGNLDLPELTFNDIRVDLPKKAREMYDQFENALRLDFKKGLVTASNAGIKSMKARQIANGGIYLDDDGAKGPRKWQNIHTAKADAVLELIEELQGSPALIAYEFLHDLARLKDALGQDTPHIGSGVSGAKSGQIIKAWNRGEIPALLGQPQSMAHGNNMQESGDTVIFHSQIWNLEDYYQFYKRVHRQGKKNKVIVHRIIANNTVDEAVIAALSRKDATQESLFDALRVYWH